ncbi:DUF1289 domain-containing protein [Oceanibaculum indicum]|uniref:Uncharacterized protein DUF1289 n=1 Tax=Oceanibaculum indicum TaxID=526216 RepID=A0A420WAS7_9PROT|nr:DUF1289 domain-containing protein [Oceanibaculum indicum]RKQ68114.1 uncharacterized protein DUF1289 [Oceanibaculum indicum]
MQHDPADLNTDRLLTMSPCQAVCRLDGDGRCAGCGRTAEEIGRWITYSDDEKNLINRRLLREAQESSLTARLNLLWRRFFGPGTAPN